MNRRDFIKNSFIVLGSSCFICGSKLIYDKNSSNITNHLIGFFKKDWETKYFNKNELPRAIKLEACTLCNLRCPHCFRITNPNEFEKVFGLGYLKFKDFKKLVDENNLEEIELSSQGDIFLNPELSDIIKYGYEKNINLTSNAKNNLNYLTDEMAENVVKYQLKTLAVSIDSASAETYNKVRVGGNFNTVIDNIKKINHYKEKYNSKYPEITYKFMLLQFNEHEINKSKILANQLNTKIEFTPNYYNNIPSVSNIELVKKKTGVDCNINLTEEYIKKFTKNPREWFFCKQLKENPQINWDGKILGCCCNYSGDFGGNVFRDGLFKALNNPKLIYAKNMLAGKAELVNNLPCFNCEKFKLLKDNELTINPTI